ncbi:hypothetical protein Tco_0174031 [Tanacetum coccineum]
MQTSSSSKFVGEPSMNPTSTILKRRNRRRSIQRVEPFSLVKTPVVTMVDQRTMEQLLQAPTEGYGYAIVIPAILAENYELKHGLLNLVTSKPFYGFDKEDPHAHIRWFNKITSTIKYRDVSNSSIKLMLFPFSIEDMSPYFKANNLPPICGHTELLTMFLSCTNTTQIKSSKAEDVFRVLLVLKLVLQLGSSVSLLVQEPL